MADLLQNWLNKEIQLSKVRHPSPLQTPSQQSINSLNSFKSYLSKRVTPNNGYSQWKPLRKTLQTAICLENSSISSINSLTSTNFKLSKLRI